jgi:hypothetical protein
MVLHLLAQTGTTETEIGIGIGIETETEIMTVTETVVVVIQIGTGVTETAHDRPGGILTATIGGTETDRATEAAAAAIGDVPGLQGVKRGETTRRRETEMWKWRTERGGEVLRHHHRLVLSRESRLDVTMDVEREIGGLVGTMRMAIPGRTGISLQRRSPKRKQNRCFSLLPTNTIGPRRYDTPYYILS